MTREEFRDKKSKDYRKRREVYGINDPVYLDEIEEAYYQGMVDADSHPHWISVEEKLPPKKSEYDDLSNNVLATNGKEIYESVYNHDFEDWFTHDMWELVNITHWMHLPQPPLVTDLNKKDLPPVSWQEGNILVEEEGGEK